MAATGSFGGFGVSFNLYDGFSSVADSIRNKFSQLSNETGSMADKVNAGLSKIQAGVAQIGIGIGLMAPVGLGIKFAGEFEAAEIGLRTLLGTEEAAHAAFVKIKEDASSTPFETGSLLAANRGLISAGKSAEEARQVVLALGNAIAASGGGENELNRMAANLQQIGTLGKASSMDIKQFGMAGINIYKLLAEGTGKTLDEVKEMDVTYEVLADSLKKASQAGGMFEGAMGRLAKSINGKFSTITDGIKFALASIGEAVMPIVHPVLDFIIEMTNKFQAFAQTGLGKTIIKIGVAALAIVSLTLILSGLKMVFLALGPIISGAFAPLLPFIAAGALIYAVIHKLVGGFDNFKLVLKGLIAVFQSAGHEGFSMSEELAQALDNVGLLDFVVAMGTWFVRIKEFFAGFIEGMTEVWNMVVYVAGVIWDIFGALIDGIVAVLDYFGISINNNSSSLETWAMWGKVIAYILGAIMVMAVISLTVAFWNMAVAVLAALWPIILIIGILVLVGWILYEVIMFIWDILVMVGQWLYNTFKPVIDLIIAYFKFWWNMVKFVAEAIWYILKPVISGIGDLIMWLYETCIEPLINAFVKLWDTVSSVMVAIWDVVSDIFTGIWDTISSFVSSIWNVGVNIVTGIWDGIKSMWNKFTDWISEAWINSILGKAFNFLVDGVVAVGTGEKTFSDVVAPENKTNAALSTLGQSNAQTQAGVDPVIMSNTTEKVISITLVNHLDSEEVGRRVYDKQQFESARN